MPPVFDEQKQAIIENGLKLFVFLVLQNYMLYKEKYLSSRRTMYFKSYYLLTVFAVMNTSALAWVDS